MNELLLAGVTLQFSDARRLRDPVLPRVCDRATTVVAGGQPPILPDRRGRVLIAGTRPDRRKQLLSIAGENL
ncbi:MAG TPA: hypothetical protein PK594_10360, partial [Mycobacterium sp.]|nr:hypothetical protein [Mycobacterium sp.]